MVRLMPMNMNVCRAFSPKGSKLNVMSEFLRRSSTRVLSIIADIDRKFR